MTNKIVWVVRLGSSALYRGRVSGAFAWHFVQPRDSLLRPAIVMSRQASGGFRPKLSACKRILRRMGMDGMELVVWPGFLSKLGPEMTELL